MRLLFDHCAMNEPPENAPEAWAADSSSAPTRHEGTSRTVRARVERSPYIWRTGEQARATAAQGRALAAALRQAGVREDPHRLDEAIDLLDAGVAGRPPGDADRADTVWDLGCLLAVRQLTGRGGPDDIDRAVRVLLEATDSPGLAAEQRAVAHLLIGQIQVGRALPDLSTEGYEQAARRLMSGGMFDMAMLSALGPIMSGAGNPELISGFDMADTHISAALDSGALPSELLAIAHGLLAFSRMLRWPPGEQMPGAGGIADLLSAAGRLWPGGMPMGQEIEALSLLVRTGEGEVDPDELRRAALQLPDGHVVSPLLFYDAAQALARRAGASGDSNALRTALDVFREAVASTDPTHPLTEALADGVGGGALAVTALDPDADAVAELRRIAEELRRSAEGTPRVARTDLLVGMAQAMAAAGSGEYAEFGGAVDKLSEAVRTLPDGDPMALTARNMLASMLVDRYQRHGTIDDLRQAVSWLATMPEVPPDGIDGPSLLGIRGVARMLLGVRTEDLNLLTEAVTDLQNSIDLYPDEAFGLARAHAGLGMAQAALGGLGIAHAARDGRSGSTEDLALISGGLARIADTAVGMETDGSDRPGLRARGGLARVLQGVVGPPDQRVATIDRGIAEIVAATTETSYLTWEHCRLIMVLATAYVMRYQVTAEVTDLDRAIDTYQEAYLAGGARVSAAETGRLLHGLAEAYQLRALTDPAARRTAIDMGIAELDAAVADVLLQTGSHSALDAARGVAARAVEIVAWCAADGEPEALAGAVEALELGRGLVLHVATSTMGVTEALLARNQPELATEWSRHIAATADRPATEPDRFGTPEQAIDMITALDMTLSQADNDIRLRVALALGENRAVTRVSVPSIAEVLRDEGIAALAYLLPPTETRAGRALLVLPDATVTALDLDGLDMARYAEVTEHQARTRQAEGDGRAAWIDSIDQLCAGAWPTVMRPLLDVLGDPSAGEPVRLVLVPCGRLAVVPWHAAYDRSGGTGALDRAVISYAASAGQLVEAARRTRLPVPATPVLVGNPTFGLLHTRLCVEGLAEDVYPGAATYGSLDSLPRGAGTPEEVLSCLPGAAVNRVASVIHLGCHADLDPGTNPLRSALQLADGRLTVEQILRHAAARPSEAPAGLVVLGACTSDATADAYDESLTLTTSMLAAGEYGVVGARWRVRDARTAVLLYAFHHHLAGGCRPAEALRAVQLWARDPRRKPVPGMPDGLVEALEILDRDPDEPGFGHVYSWAAFAHHGC